MAPQNQNNTTLVNNTPVKENPGNPSGEVQQNLRKRTSSVLNLWSTRLRSRRSSSLNMSYWSKLPEDLLYSIVDRIVEEEDFIALRGVCKSWRSAVPKSYWKRVPWLLAKKYESGKVILKGLNSLTESTNTLTSVFQTELSWRYWGSFTGWILGQNQLDYRLQLINPLTGVVINLPKLQHTISKGLIYYAPSTNLLDPTIEIMAISPSYTGIAYIKREFQEWRFLADNQYKSCFEDLVWYEGRVVAIRDDGTIVFFDEVGIAVSLNPPSNIVKDHNALYLVESSGDLLIVVQRHVILFGRHFEVFKLDLNYGHWKQVTGLGRHSLFVGESYSISRRINGGNGNIWKPSCIYYTKYNPISEKKLYYYDIAKKRMEFHSLDHVDDIDRSYDFNWYMPAVGTK